jgi:hypothetical protein
VALFARHWLYVMSRRKPPVIDARAEIVLTRLFTGLIAFASMLGLFGQLLR